MGRDLPKIQPEDTIFVLKTKDGLPQLLQEKLTEYGYKFLFFDDLTTLLSYETPQAPRVCLIEHHKEVKPDTTLDFIRSATTVFENAHLIVFGNDCSIPFAQDCFQAGAQSVVTLPFETESFLNQLFENAPIQVPEKKLDMLALAPVSILELERFDSFPFDVFLCLPANRKVLAYRRKGSNIDKSFIDRFRDNPQYSLFIQKSDLPTYQQFIGNLLADTKGDESLNSRQQVLKLRADVGQLLNHFFCQSEFNEDKSKAALENLRKVMNEFVASTSPNKEFYRRLVTLSSMSFSNHGHSVNVSTYAALFGLYLGYTDQIEALSTAGLLHDVGMSLLPGDIGERDISQLSNKEKEKYFTHMQSSVDMLKEKKFSLSPEIELAILQHHECRDGSGPLALKADQISPLAKILSVADEFDELTTQKFGKRRFTPAQALLEMAGYGKSPQSKKLDLEFHGDLLIQLIAKNEELSQADVDRELAKKAM